MYEELKKMIDTGDFDIVAMLSQIDILWDQEILTESQKEELAEHAQRVASSKTKEDIFAMLEAYDNPQAAPQENAEEGADE